VSARTAEVVPRGREWTRERETARMAGFKVVGLWLLAVGLGENRQWHIDRNTGLRPDEAARLEFRDVAIVTDEATGERILEIEVRGK
jgi:hypothetical protein